MTNYCFFFNLVFLSRTFTIHRTTGEGGGYFFNSSLFMRHKIMWHNRFNENKNEAMEAYIPQHRDVKTKKPRHRDSKTK